MAEFTEIVGGLQFPEGPVWMPDGSWLVVELAAGTVARITRDGRRQVIATPGGSPNGAALGPDGHLYICNSGGFSWEKKDGLLWPVGTPDDYSGGRIERVDLTTGRVERLYDMVDGLALSGPNDIVFDAHGGLWFSDHGKRRAHHVECGGLYYGQADGSLVKRVVYPLVTANGVGLSPDGKTVYVAETDTGHISGRGMSLVPARSRQRTAICRAGIWRGLPDTSAGTRWRSRVTACCTSPRS